MAEYRVEFAPSALKELRALPLEVKQRVSASVEALATNPRPRGCVKLKGYQGLYRVRIGVYRLVYRVRDLERLVRITVVRHRREVYD